MSDATLKACGLWQRTSQSGTDYLVGRWGGLKVLVLPNRDRRSDDDPTHVLMIAEAAETPRPAGQDARTTSRTSRSRRPSAALQRAAADAQAPLDDLLPDYMRG